MLSQLLAGRVSASEQMTFQRGRAKLQARSILGPSEEPVHTQAIGTGLHTNSLLAPAWEGLRDLMLAAGTAGSEMPCTQEVLSSTNLSTEAVLGKSHLLK